MSTIRVVSAREFRDNQKELFDFAETGRVLIKKGKKVFELVANPTVEAAPVENPSPSNDPFFADERNVSELAKRVAKIESGLEKFKSIPNFREHFGIE